jgi:hypothetical protein
MALCAMRTPKTIPAIVPPDIPLEILLLPDVSPPLVDPPPGVDVDDATAPERIGIPVAEADNSTTLDSTTPYTLCARAIWLWS